MSHRANYQAGRTVTEVRGLDEYDEPDWPIHADTILRKGGHHVTQRELLDRPLVGNPLALDRCHCGRPLCAATGLCKLNHPRPHGETTP